jgi:hypothetical protein
MSESLRWSETTTPLRGCQLCDHGRDLATPDADLGALCRCPAVAGRHAVHTLAARARGGACGPDAAHFTLKGVLL